MSGRVGAPRPEDRARRWGWWVALALIALGGLVLRAWNLDFDQRQHLHPDERHWALTSAALDRAEAPAPHGTFAGPVLDWLDGQRSPANPYRGSDSFVYGPVTLAVGRATAGWLHDGAATGAQPASAIVHGLDALGLPLLDDTGAPRFDDAYQVDLIGRLLGALFDTLTIVVVALIGRRVLGPLVGLVAAGLMALSVMAIQHAHFFGSEPALGLASALTLAATLALDRGDDRRAAVRSGAWAGLAAGATLAVKLSGLGIATVPFLVAGVVSVRRRRRVDVIRIVVMLVAAFVAFRVLCPSAFNGLGLRPNAQFLDDQRRAQELAMADLPPSLQWAGRPFLLTPLQFLVGYTVGPGSAVAALVGSILLVRRRLAGRATGWIVVAGWLVPFAVVLRSPVTTGRYFVPMLPALYVAAAVGVVVLARTGVAAARPASAPVAFVRALARPAAAMMVALAALWGLAFVNGVYGHEHTRVAASHWIAERVPAGSTLSAEAWDDALPLAVPGVDPGTYPTLQLEVVAPDSVAKIEQLATRLHEVDYVVESSARVWGVVGRIPARFPSSIEFFEALDDGTLGFDRVARFTSPPRLGPFRLDERWAEEAFSVYDHPEVRVWERRRDVGVDDIIARLDPVAAATAMPVPPARATANGTLLEPDELTAAAAIAPYDQQFATDANPWLQALGWLVVIELLGLAAFVVMLPLLRRLPDGGLGVSKLLGIAAVAFGTFAMNTWLGVTLGRGLVGGCAGVLLVAGGGAAWRRRDELRALWVERRTTLVIAELVGLVAFAAVLALRAADPDLWHPWRGGEKPMELTMLTTVLRTRTLPPPDPWFAGGTLNYYYGAYLLLSVPARLLRTAPTLALNLGAPVMAMLGATTSYSAAAALRVIRPGDSGAVGRARRSGARRAGLLGVGLVMVVPNVMAISRSIGWVARREVGAFDWWAVSRVIPAVPSPTEFPAWSVLFADVHPHVFGLSVLAALVTLTLAWWDAFAARRAAAAVVGLGLLVGFVVGLARFVNTWDLPLALVTVGLTVVAMVATASSRWRLIAASAAGAAAAFVIAWAPFTRRMEVTDAGFAASAHQVPLGSWAQQFGLFAALTVVTVVRAGWRRDPAGAGFGPSRTGLLLAAGGSVAAGTAFVVADATAAVSTALAVAAAAGAVAARRASSPRVPPFALAVTAMGWLTLVTIEIVHVANDFTLNTIFKGWFEAWLFLALGLAAAVEPVLFGTPSGAVGRVTRGVAGGLVGVAAVGALAFAGVAVPSRAADRISADGPSLDGLAYLDELTYPGPDGEPMRPGDDRPLIEWLQANVTGLPTIAEAPGVLYQWTSRVATATGLPTVVGWPWHETQQRRTYGRVVDQRTIDLTALFTSGDEREITRVLQTYRVGYLVFGTTERAIADAAATAALVGYPCFDVVERNGDLWLAAVDQDCVDQQRGAWPVWPQGDEGDEGEG